MASWYNINDTFHRKNDNWWRRFIKGLNNAFNENHAWFDYDEWDNRASTIGNLANSVTSLVDAVANPSVIESVVNKYTGNELTGAEREANAFSAEEAQKSRDFTEYMARNKYSMETESMQNAGINPAMVYGGGSLVPTASNGAAASSVSPTGGIADLIPAIMSIVRAPLELQKMQKETEKIDADISNTQADTEGKQIQNEINQATKDSIIRFTELSADEKAAQVDKILQETKSEKIKTDILGVQLIQDKLTYDQNKRMNDLLFERQQLDNEYQRFVNEHQEAQFNRQMDALDAQIYDLYKSAEEKMSATELNNATTALRGAETDTEKERTKTQQMTTEKERYEAARAYYDPKAHMTRAIVAPMEGIRNAYRSAREAAHRATQRQLSGRDRQKRQAAARLQEMYATTGQAITEYGE